MNMKRERRNINVTKRSLKAIGVMADKIKIYIYIFSVHTSSISKTEETEIFGEELSSDTKISIFSPNKLMWGYNLNQNARKDKNFSPSKLKLVQDS